MSHPNSVFGPARYGDRCSLDSEIIGHPVPPFSDSAHGILNAYAVGVAGSLQKIPIGYLYTTMGGDIYFVPSARAFSLGITSYPDNASLDVGPNSLVSGSPTLSATVISRMAPLMKSKEAPQFLYPTGQNGPACYSADWDGQIPN